VRVAPQDLACNPTAQDHHHLGGEDRQPSRQGSCAVRRSRKRRPGGYPTGSGGRRGDDRTFVSCSMGLNGQDRSPTDRKILFTATLPAPALLWQKTMILSIITFWKEHRTQRILPNPKYQPLL